MNTNILKEALNLSDNEKLELIENIWESLENPFDIPLSKEQKDELDRRLELYYLNKSGGSSWHDVKKRILR